MLEYMCAYMHACIVCATIKSKGVWKAIFYSVSDTLLFPAPCQLPYPFFAAATGT